MATEAVNGVGLRYELSGDGAVPLVLVHGSWGSHGNWDPVVSALAKTFRVLTYDRRGHGDSEAPSGQGSVRDDVADLAGLIEALDLAPAYVAGNSFGASITLRLAAERPDLLRGIIAHEPPLFALLSDDPSLAPVLGHLIESVGSVVERIESGELEDAVATFMAMALAPGEWKALPAEFQETAFASASTFLDEAKDPEALAFDLAWLAGFSKPALLTIGDASPPQYAPALKKVSESIAQSEFVTFPGVGHLPHVTHPAVYIDAVTTFIAKHERS